MRVTGLLVLALTGLAIGAAVAATEEQVVVDGITFNGWTDYFTSDYFRLNGKRCGTSASIEQAGGGFEDGTPADCSAGNTNPAPEYAPPAGILYEIPVVVHIIAPSVGHPADIADARVYEQIQILNEDFQAIAGSNGAPGTNVRVQFCLASVDPAGNPTTGITRSYNLTWFNDGGSYWTSLAWDPHHYLNIYTNNAGGNLGYVPFLPASAPAQVGQPQDRVVVLYSAFGLTSYVPYHLGRSATHEVGHYLGLYHTFEGGCASATAPGCYTSGDRLCDTGPEQSPEFACSPLNSCGDPLPEPIHNYMDYSEDICMWEFTLEGAHRIRCTLTHYRPNVHSVGVCNIVAVQNQISPRTLYALYQNTPNPFNPTTHISFEMPAAGMVNLTVLDVSGRVIRNLAAGSFPAGTHDLVWDGTDDANTSVGSGVYFYRLDANGTTQTRRMVLLK